MTPSDNLLLMKYDNRLTLLKSRSETENLRLIRKLTRRRNALLKKYCK